MRIASSTFTNNFLLQVNSLQQQQTSLQNEASTGLKVSLPEDNPQVMGQVLQLQTQSAATSQYQNNITTLQSAATNSGAAMNSLKAITDRLGEITTLAASGTTSSDQMSSYSTEVGQLLKQAVQIGNTQDGSGRYIFGGTRNTSPPFTTTAAADGSINSVTYVGDTLQNQSEIAPNVLVSPTVPGANSIGARATGLFADTRTGADLFNHMLTLQSDLAANNKTAISTNDAPAIARDEHNVISSISANGVMQSALSSASSMISTRATNLTAQISGATSADLATTLTRLSQTQTAYQAALESGTQIMNLSLLNYLH
jgi:flagellar hook-associated protein 3 FlgL